MPPTPHWCVKIGPSDSLEQGDLLDGVPCPSPRYSVGIDYTRKGANVGVPVKVRRIAVMTHTCDVRKVPRILLCPVKSYDSLKTEGKPLADARAQTLVERGVHPAFFLIHASAPDGPDLGELVVEFRDQSLISKAWLQDFAYKAGVRLRLQENIQIALLHRFGEFFSRPLIDDEEEVGASEEPESPP